MRLGRRIVIATGTLVVLMGLLTVGLLQAIIANALGSELNEKGTATARVLADDLANPLLDGDALVVQRALNRFRQEGASVIYAYAYIPDRGQIIHTFPGGFPVALLRATRLDPGQSTEVRFLRTEQGRVRDFGVRVLDGLSYEVHVGLTEDSILASSRHVTWLVGGMTAVGVLVATALAWVLGRYVARPLERLAAAAEEIGEGHLDREIAVSGKDEVGVLADSFNRMVRSLREAMSRERTRNRELTALNAVAQVVSLGEELREVLARSLGEVVDALRLKGAWIVLEGQGEDEPADLAAVVGINRSLVEGCADRLGMYCGCRRALKAAEGAGESDPPGQCSVSQALGPGFALLGPFPLVSGGRQLGFLSAVLPSGAELDPQDQKILAGVARQLGVALERSLLWRRLLEREERVSQLLQQVIDAQEEERRRIARELHDETSQSMAALTVGLKVASSLIERDPRRAERILEGLKDATALTLREIHNIVYDLRPTLLDDMGLVPALHWCATRWLSEQGVEVEVTTEGISQRLPQRVETSLYRIGQEAINNVAKHAGARHVRIHLEGDKGQVHLSVVDDGRGFAGTETRWDHGEKPSLGLVGMAERASLLGGECAVASVPGEGTRVMVTIPLPEGGVSAG